MIKRLFLIFMFPALAACSTNPATGRQQFAGLMSPQQELQIGGQEHQKVIKEYGLYNDEKLQNYLDEVGRKVSQYTERQDVSYKFYLLDSPQVNAFALPGGYVYITRGIMALAGSEAEFASVVGHEVGHITGRHSAERYSRSVVTGLGAQIISIAVGEPGVSDALGLGANLYLSSHSRRQESEADSLGIRYLSRSGYAPQAAESFFERMQLNEALEMKKAKRKGGIPNYFSTHPQVKDRVAKTGAEAVKYGKEGLVNSDKYLRMIDGMTYGDSADQGFVKGRDFYHPKLGFAFQAPENYRIINSPTQVVMQGEHAIMAFDIVSNPDQYNARRYLEDVWLAKYQLSDLTQVTVNGMRGATASVHVEKQGTPITLRFFSIEWKDGKIARFLVEMPRHYAGATALRDAVYSFRRLSQNERNTLKPYRIKIVISKRGETVASMANRMEIEQFKEEEFRVLNGLKPNDRIEENRSYKIVVH